MNRKQWSLDEDIFVLSECRNTQWKWGDVAKKIVNRNQHQIKNRFIYLMSKGLDCKKKILHEMIKKKSLDVAVLSVLEGLRSDLSKNQYVNENDNKTEENGSQISQEDLFGLEKTAFYFSLEFL